MRKIIVSTLLFFLLQSAIGQSITFTLDFSGGFCTVCSGSNGNYACSNGTGIWNGGVKTFADPLPVGATITGISVKVNYTGNCLGTGSYSVNFNNVGAGSKSQQGSCICNQCFNDVFNPSISNYNYGGTNTIQTSAFNATICIHNYEVTLTYSLQSISTSSLSSNSFCPGATLSVPYTANGNYNNGNSFTAQLSDASGSFASLVNIGYITAATSGSINATIPANVIYGTGYRIRVISDNPVVTGTDNGTNLILGDNQKPTVVAQNITVQLDASGAATITPAQINNGSADNCTAAANLQLALDKTSFDCSNVGPNTVTLMVTDANNNFQTGTATVTVEDKIKPTVITQNITIQLDANGAASITPAQINNGSTDNCTAAANLQLALDKTSFDCSNVGANTVTLTVTDANTNAQTGTAIVTVQDKIKPTVVTQNITIQLDESGAAIIIPAQINNGSTDNCTAAANLQLALDKSSFNCSNVGPNIVILTVTDANGNAQMGTATVTVEDKIKPTVITQNITIQLDANGAASITAAQINNGSTDNCTAAANLQLALDKTSFSCSNVGPNTVTLTVTDANGNAQTGTATVTVEDKIKPTVVTQNITVQLDANGTASITPAQINNGSADNCTAASNLQLALDKTSFNCSNVGPNTVTLTVTDANGNVQMGTATVTVEDKIKPAVVTQNITVQLDVNGAASITPAQINNGSSDNCSIPANGYSLSKSSFNCSNVGANTVTLTVTDANNNSQTGTATVTVEDKIKPTVVTQNITVQLDASGAASITPAQINNGSTGNCTAAANLQLALDKSSFNCSNVGPNTVILSVTDANGNVQMGTATVTVEDKIKPTVVTQNITVQLDASGAASITPAQINNGSSDNCSIPANGYSLSKSNFNCSNVGVNTVTLTVTDANNNSQPGTATVTVQDKIKPTVVTQNITIQLDASGAASITPAQINNGSTDNCSIPANGYSLNKSSFNCINVGANTVTLTVTDANGNSQTATATVTVQDKIKPVALCQSIDVYLGLNGTVSITAQQVDNGSSDNCSVTLSIDKSSFNTANVGPNNVVLTITDQSGNSSTCTAVVTVKKRPTTLQYTGDGSEQYSDQQLLTAVLKDQMSGGTVVASKTINFTLGSQSASAITNASGVANANLILIQDPAPVYTVTTSFAGDATFVASSDNDPFDITQEDARINFTGTQLVATQSSSSGVATVTLRATVQDITATPDAAGDIYSGDIRKAKVRFLNNNVPIVISGLTDANGWVLNPIILVNPADTKTGIVTLNWPVDIGTATDAEYTIGMEVSGYYTRKSQDDNTVITVYKPVGDFITGGGYIIPIQSAGQYASDAGKKTNFGFNVKYGKSGNNLQGNMNFIFRRTVSGVQRVYQIKSNSMTSLGVNVSNPNAQTAQFISKCNLTDITNPLSPISLGGNLTMQVNMTDRGEPGNNDDIAISLYNGSAILYSSSWTGNNTALMLLAGGNLVVHSGFSVGAANTTGQKYTTPILTIPPALEVKVLPNPTSYYFNLALKSGSKEKVTITVIDVAGRVIEQQTAAANSTLQLGNKYHPGIYIAEVRQGNDKVILRLIKEGE